MDALNSRPSLPGKKPTPAKTPLTRRLQIFQQWAKLPTYEEAAKALGLGGRATWSNVMEREELSKDVALAIYDAYPEITLEWLWRGHTNHLRVETLDELREVAERLGPEFLAELGRPRRR